MTHDEIPQGVRAAIELYYEPLELLRGGGMATVIKARERMLGREVVIKVLPQLAASDELRARFRQEILLAAALQHPQIVPVLTAFEIDGAPAYVMPYVAGESLRERIRRGPRSVRETVSVLLDVARALEQAHALGVVHRDIKPGNILLTKSSAVVTDFGIAKLRSTRSPAIRTLGDLGTPEDGAITREGISLGTAAYMAPEQVVGDPGADHRMDLYALGLVAYEMLVGAHPFPHAAPHRVMAAQLTEHPTPISRRRNDVPPGLEALIMRCLEKDPGARPPSAAALVRTLQDADALERAGAHRPVAAERTWRSRATDAVITYAQRDLLAAVRGIRRAPFVTAAAILSLALGIGANAAIYSLFDQLLLRPLPVHEPSRLVNLSLPGPRTGSWNCDVAGPCEDVFSYPMFRELERGQNVLSGLAMHQPTQVSLAVNNESTVGDGVWISASYFPVLGLRPALGRLLGPADDATGAAAVTVISHAYWRERFTSDPSVIGRTLLVNGQALEIVGVAPRGFEGTTTGTRPMVYMPVSIRPLLEPDFRGLERRTEYWAYLFGRLGPGVSIAQAKVALDGVVRPILSDVEAPLQRGLSDDALTRFLAREFVITSGSRGQSTMHVQTKRPLTLLFAATGLVLLIACANIANLLLVRGAGRATEMGVRLAIGASRRALVTQLLTESLLLALVGGAASLFVARWTLDGIASLLPPDSATALEFSLQAPVVAFAGLLAVATGFAFGMFPALHSTRTDLISTIRAGAGQIAGGRTAARFRSALVTVQIALSMVLLISAGLFLQSLRNVARVDLGVAVNEVVTFALAPMRVGHDEERAALLLGRVEEEIRTLPGVSGVASSSVPLLTGDSWVNIVRVQGYPAGPDADAHSTVNTVGAGYFTTLGVPLLAGRDFEDTDRREAARVAIVNETFARKFGLGTDAVGKFIGRGGSAGDPLDIRIVGLIRDAAYSSVKDAVPPALYLPWRQVGMFPAMHFHVRASRSPEPLLSAIPAAMKRIDPTLPLIGLKTMPQQIRETVFLDRMIGILSAAFAVLATLLAAIGLYGVLSYATAQRTREIGVRMALGADPRRIRAMVMRQVGVMLAIGGVVGVGAAVAVGRAAQSLLFGLDGGDPAVFGAAILVLAMVATVAGYLPARRAARIDPLQALRSD